MEIGVNFKTRFSVGFCNDAEEIWYPENWLLRRSNTLLKEPLAFIFVFFVSKDLKMKFTWFQWEYKKVDICALPEAGLHIIRTVFRKSYCNLEPTDLYSISYHLPSSGREPLPFFPHPATLLTEQNWLVFLSLIAIRTRVPCVAATPICDFFKPLKWFTRELTGICLRVPVNRLLFKKWTYQIVLVTVN